MALAVRQPLFATLARIGLTRLVMAQERELVPLETLQAEERRADERWPVPYAIMVIVLVSVALWSVIIAGASWLIG